MARTGTTRGPTTRGPTRRRLTGPGLVAALLVGALVLAACSGGGDRAASPGGGAPEPGLGAVGEDREPDDDGAGEGTAGDRAAGDRAADRAAPAAGERPLVVGAAAGRQLIRRAHLTLESSDPTRTVEEIRGVVERLGGFVADAELGRDGTEALSGSITLRIPAEALDGAVERLTAMESVTAVTGQRIESEDVTGELTDVESELRNLRAVETELRALLSEIRRTSQSADQVLQIFSRIREVRSEIERLEGRRATLRDLVALATVHVTVTPDAEVPPPGGGEPWMPGGIVRDALSATVTALQGIATAAIWLGLTVVPILALTLLPVGAVAWWLRRLRPAAGDGPPAPADR